MNGEQFENFIDYAPLIATQARKELKDGFVQPTPYSDVCRICRYGGACGWDFEKKPRVEKAVKPSMIAEIAKSEKEKI